MNQETQPVQQVRERRSGHPVLALVFITLGIIILLQNFHMINGNVWEVLWRFWPLILVLWGIQAILGHSRVSSLLVFILGLLMIGAIISLPMLGMVEDGWWHTGNVKEETQHVTVGENENTDAVTRKVSLDNGIGRVDIKDATDNQLYTWDATYYTGYKPALSRTQDGPAVNINIDAQHRNGLSWFMGSTPHYELTLGRPQLKTSLNIDSGVGEVSVSLDHLVLSALHLQVGTGSANVDLASPSIPDGASSIDVGTGSCKLVVPNDVGLKLRYNVGLGSVRVDSTSLHGNGTYTSPDYDNAARKLDLQVDIGTGSLTIVK